MSSFSLGPLDAIFVITFVINLTISAICFSLRKKGHYMKYLGILSIIVGCILGFVRIEIQSVFSFINNIHLIEIFFLIFMVDITLVPALVFGSKWTFESKTYGTQWQHGAKALVFLISFILIMTVVGANLIPITKSHYYSYRVGIYPTDDRPYFVNIPILLDSNGLATSYVEHLRITKGSGNISVVQTEHGLALNISSKGDFETEVSSKSQEAFNSISLRKSVSVKVRYETYWVYYHTQSNESMRFVQMVKRDAFDSYDNWRINGTIEPNIWTTVNGTHTRMIA